MRFGRLSQLGLVGFIAAAGLLGGCPSSGGGNGGGAGSGGGAADYAAVSAILGGPEQAGAGSCAFASSCHGGDGPGKAGLNFKSVKDITAALVNVDSCENSAMKRVKPGDPDHSWIWIKLTSEVVDANTGKIAPAGTPSSCTGVATGFGTRMPQVSGYEKLAPEKLATIKAWIEAGAPGPN